MNWPVCDKCGKDVRTEDGVIDIDTQEINDIGPAWEVWNQAHPGPVPLNEFLNAPGSVKWQWGHLACVTGDMYQIPADRFDSLGKALDWTLHMTEKPWLPNTDWNSLVRRLHDIPSA